jgi:uncharacterized protein (DUF433 family)
MNTSLSRISTNKELCGGKPCIRGMRIRVSDVLDLLANGLSLEQVLEEFPELEAVDIKAVLVYASAKVNHTVIHAA